MTDPSKSAFDPVLQRAPTPPTDPLHEFTPRCMPMKMEKSSIQRVSPFGPNLHYAASQVDITTQFTS